MSGSVINVSSLGSCQLPTQFGEFQLSGVVDPESGLEHAVLTMGTVGPGEPLLTRIHSECLTGDAFFSLRCDCGPQLRAAIKAIASKGRGLIMYLRQEGRGIGFMNKVRAYSLQDTGFDTVDANRLLGYPDDLRDYGIAKWILEGLGVSTINLMTNNPDKVRAIESLGICVANRAPLYAGSNPHNVGYLKTKIARMGHYVESPGL